MVSLENRLKMREMHRTENLARQNTDHWLRIEQKAHLASEYGVTGNHKLDLLYSKAYDMGHSGGFSEVANYFADLVELIR